jgi:hypothetical protein
MFRKCWSSDDFIFLALLSPALTGDEHGVYPAARVLELRLFPWNLSSLSCAPRRGRWHWLVALRLVVSAAFSSRMESRLVRRIAQRHPSPPPAMPILMALSLRYRPRTSYRTRRLGYPGRISAGTGALSRALTLSNFGHGSASHSAGFINR